MTPVEKTLIPPQGDKPLMADLMSGPNAPMTRAFLSCGWRCITVDWLIDPSHDLSNPHRQKSLSTQLQSSCFIAAALDCSTKSRIREIPRVFADGTRAPGPLRTDEHPMGIPTLQGRELERVQGDNMATAFVLEEFRHG